MLETCFGGRIWMQQTRTSVGTQVLPGLLMVLKMEMAKKSKHQLCISQLTAGFFDSKLTMQRRFMNPFPEMLQNTEEI